MDVGVSGIGVVSAFGWGAARLWHALSAGENGIRTIARFPTAHFDVHLGGVVPDRNAPAWHDAASLCVEFALFAAREAWRQANLGSAPALGQRVALVLGTSLTDHREPLHRITERVADELGVGGPRMTISTACTSSANAVGLGLDLLQAGDADVVIAGGSDVLTPLVLSGFHALGVLSHEKCAPFSGPPGTTLGEGAGFLVLEARHAAAARGVTTVFSLLGYGLSADAFHDTGPDPTGNGVARAMSAALRHGGACAADVSYLNAHGTGTAANDPAEWRAIRQVFGEQARLPVSSSKSFLGHAQGAAGIVEIATTLLAAQNGTIPPTHQFTKPRANSPTDPVAQQLPRARAVDTLICNSSAFGGANCAVVFARSPREIPAKPVRPVFVSGVSALGPHGSTLDALADALADAMTEAPLGAQPGRPLKRGQVIPFAFGSAAPSVDPRGLDPLTRYLVAATGLAFSDAGVRIRQDRQHRTGIVMGIDRVSSESHKELWKSIHEHGERCLSASHFSRMVLNAPVGSCSKLHGLKGPLSTVSAGGASGLLAIAYGAHLLSSREDADTIVTGAADEMDADSSSFSDEAFDSEGAACVVLANTVAHGVAIRLAGWCISGPGSLSAAAQVAVKRAGLRASEVEMVVGPGGSEFAHARHLDTRALFRPSSTLESGLSMVIAALLLRRDKAKVALVCARGESCDVAVVIKQEQGASDVQ